MPPTLDLSKTPTHGSMLLSPRLPLRRSPSFNSLLEKGPPSAKSSGFSFGNFLDAPVSPALPSLVPRHGKPTTIAPKRKYSRVLLWFAGVIFLLYYGSQQLRFERGVPAVGWSTTDGETFEMVGDDELPNFPTPIIVTDKRGRTKWTISIPQTMEFPLQPKQYYDMCMASMEVAAQVEDLHSHKHTTHTAHYGYYHVDGNYMDVQEAIENKLLPSPAAPQGNSIFDNFKGEKHLMVGEVPNTLVETPVCEKSMTFIMETSNAGLGHTLMMLWTAYGLAKQEGRAFFIDDTRWAYGKYLNLFQPPPMPACQPPPRHEIVACPHHARHLIVSAANAPWLFGGQFNEYYEDARKMEVFRQKPMFDFAAEGYKALFSLNKEDDEYVNNRIEGLRNRTFTEMPENDDGILIGVHVRHGDRHPLEFQYADSYIPLDRYSKKARELLHAAFEKADGSEDMMAEMKSAIVVASDDPDVYESDEFSHAFRAQEQIRLASQKTLMGAQEPKPTPPRRSIRGFVEETIGWEGGFYAPMFWSLGTPGKTAADSNLAQAKVTPTQETIRLRELVGRAYLMDLAVLGQSSDRIVCTVSSMTCKLLAVIMGWEASFEYGYWKNIDGDFEWRGVEW